MNAELIAKSPNKVVKTTEFLDALSKCVASPDQAYSLPPACYADASVFETEIETIFHSSWISVGRADRLPKPGDYMTLDIAKSPTIILRDEQGKLHAFANSCRHRGARLLDGEGTCRVIRCPFHSWIYQLDGSLTGTSKMEETKNFEQSDHGLVEFKIAERLGFAFVCMSDEPKDIDACLGDFEQLHKPWGLASFTTTRHRKFEVNCNWKGFLDVFNEHYHLKFVHPNTISSLYESPHAADDTSGAYASQYGETAGTGGLLEGDEEHGLPSIPGLEKKLENGVRYTWVFPNMTFAIGADALWIYEAYPLGPGRCEVHQTICFPPETIELEDFAERVKYYYHRMDAAIEEDIPALENQQKGLSSLFSRQGRFSPHLEANVAAFAKWYAEELL